MCAPQLMSKCRLEALLDSTTHAGLDCNGSRAVSVPGLRLQDVRPRADRLFGRPRRIHGFPATRSRKLHAPHTKTADSGLLAHAVGDCDRSHHLRSDVALRLTAEAIARNAHGSSAGNPAR